MDRRNFLASSAMLPSAFVQAAEKITHVNTETHGPALKSSVVKLSSLKPEGDAPGAKAYVNFNGPTTQLAALAAGAVKLDPGARPHPPHRHPEEEIVIIASGTGEITVDGKVTQVSAGDMMYAEANVLHGILNTGKTEMVFYFTKTLPKKV